MLVSAEAASGVLMAFLFSPEHTLPHMLKAIYCAACDISRYVGGLLPDPYST
jgi:hypothetical protein